MSRIEELMARYCPNGVEFRPLGELVRIKNGRDHKTLPSCSPRIGWVRARLGDVP